MVAHVAVVVALAVVLTPLLLYVHARAWRRALRVARSYDEVHTLTTPDGERCTLLRYHPRGQPAAFAPPVVLCHGLATTRYCLDLDDAHSLALFLAEAGRDVWLLELRGRGLSRAAGVLGAARLRHAFDDYVRHDVPAAIDFVRERSGAAELDWVGYSMGGMVMYAHLATDHGRAAVRAFVAIASPASFVEQRRHVGWALWLERVTGHRTAWWFELLSALAAPVTGFWYPPPARIALNPRNFAARTMRRVMVNVLCSCSRFEMRQFHRFAVLDRFDAEDGERDYRASLASVVTPSLFLAGAVDRIAPPGAVKLAHDTIASPRRAYRVIEDHGHTDIVLGERARHEVFPHVLAWLDEHDRLATGVAGQGASTAPSLAAAE